MALEGPPKDQPAGGQQEPTLFGTNPFQSSTGSRLTLDLTDNPCATGGTHVIQIIGGEVSRVIAAREGVAVPGPRPTRGGEMRACNHGGGPSIAVQARRPVFIRTVDGQEQIVYRTSEMDECRLYTVEWNGEPYALRKSDRDVEVFKFRPDGDGDGD